MGIKKNLPGTDKIPFDLILTSVHRILTQYITDKNKANYHGISFCLKAYFLETLLKG